MTETTEEKGLIPYREPTGGDSVKAFIPNDFPSVFRFSELLAESGDMVPKAYIGQPAKIATAIFFGYEIGLLPLQALQSIAVINGKPSIYGDAALALVRGSGYLDDFEEDWIGGDFLNADNSPNQEFGAICKVTRKGAKRPTKADFTIGDAIRAGLWSKDGPWKTYPKRMLKMRARAFALRDEFTDVLRGIGIAEETGDYEDMRNITPKDELPAAPEPKKRGPKPKEAPANKYQAGDAGDGKGAVEEAEVISEKKGGAAAQATTSTDDEIPAGPAATKPANIKPAAEKKPAPPKEDAGQAGQIMLDDLLSRVGADKELKDHLKYLHKILAVPSTQDDAKAVWMSREAMKGVTTSQRVFIDELRNWHKDRITKLEEAEALPAGPGASDNQDDEGEERESVFDYDGFKAHVAAELAKVKTPDDANKAFSDLTDGPVADRLISEDQFEGDLKPLLEAALERTDGY